MLTIPRDQLEKLADKLAVDGAQRFREHLQQSLKPLSERFPERLEIDTILQSFSKARRYGFQGDEQVGKFALLAFVLGEDFDLNPRNHGLLTETLLPPQSRLDHMLGWIEVQAQRLASSQAPIAANSPELRGVHTDKKGCG